MKKLSIVLVVTLSAVAAVVSAQGLDPDPVFDVRIRPDREPIVAGQPLRLAAVLDVERGWHVNTDSPGDEFSIPTTLDWELPEGWPPPEVRFPDGRQLLFAFSETPIEVWEGRVVMVAELVVPDAALGRQGIGLRVTAQACDDTRCLPPVEVVTGLDVEVAPPGTASRPVNEDLFAGPGDGGGGRATELAGDRSRGTSGGDEALDSRLARISLPIQVAVVFLIGLGLAFTPCVYPLIPITISFFSQQAAKRPGGTFGLALVYVLGIAVTYSSLGVVAALTGQLFGTALQSPLVVALIVLVLVALALSMFGVWELRVPAWATRAAGGRQGYLGSLVMGLVVGVVAAPCVGPAVVGLLTYIGERGDPVLGFTLFFALSMGLGLPYLVLGTFTGAINRMPASGMWMVGVRKVFGVLLIALAAYFARPLLPGGVGSWLIGLALIIGGAWLLVVERTGHEQPAVDRVMRVVTAGMLLIGLAFLPVRGAEEGRQHLEWMDYDAASVEAAIASGRPVIVDFYADWCAPCRELDEKTFSDPRVQEALADFARFKVDETRPTSEGEEAAEAFQVRGMPTVIVYRDSAEVFRITGFEHPESFLDLLREE